MICDQKYPRKVTSILIVSDYLVSVCMADSVLVVLGSQLRIWYLKKKSTFSMGLYRSRNYNRGFLHLISLAKFLERYYIYDQMSAF